MLGNAELAKSQLGFQRRAGKTGEKIHLGGSRPGMGGQKGGRVVSEVNCLLWEFVSIWSRLKAFIFNSEGEKNYAFKYPILLPLADRHLVSYPLTPGREGRGIILILIGAEVSYFLFLLYHWKIFHMYLQSHRLLEHQKSWKSPVRALPVRAVSRGDVLELSEQTDGRAQDKTHLAGGNVKQWMLRIKTWNDK